MTLESPLDCKEIKPVNPEGNQLWLIIGRTDAEIKASVFWLPDMNSQLIGEDVNAEKDWRQEDWRQEEKWAPEVNMVT